jgi:hypothetical protein
MVCGFRARVMVLTYKDEENLTYHLKYVLYLYCQLRCHCVQDCTYNAREIMQPLFYYIDKTKYKNIPQISGIKPQIPKYTGTIDTPNTFY